MKILIVNKFLYPNGGSETYIFEIGKCLTEMGHEVQYFGMEHEGRIVGNHAEIYTNDMDFHDNGEGGFAKIANKVKKLTYPFKIIYSKEAAAKMIAVLDDFKPDIVHLNNINFQLTPSIIEAVADYDRKNGTDTKIVSTAHDSQWVCPGHLLRVPSDGRRCFDCEGGKYYNCAKNKCIHGSTLRSTLGAFEAYFYKSRETYGLVDVVICPSNFMKEKLETNPELDGKCVVLHNFMPEHKDEDSKAEISKSEDSREKICKSEDNKGEPITCDENIVDANICEGEANKDIINDGLNNASELPDKYVLYLGRFSEEKGIDTLLKVCKLLPEVRFIFAGNGPLKDEVDAVDNIDDIGFVSGQKLQNLIHGARFIVFPSECHENCSFTVMESISSGTPIIASATGGTPELVTTAENADSDGLIPNGELFEAGNIDELKTRLENLWNDDALLERYRHGCEQVHFDTIREYCEKLIEIYDKI